MTDEQTPAQMPYPHVEQPTPVLFRYRRDGQPEPDQDGAPDQVDLPLVAYTVLQDQAGAWCAVSTVFLGIDASLGFADTPLLWETLVWGGAHHGRLERYGREDYARAGHMIVVQDVMDRWGQQPAPAAAEDDDLQPAAMAQGVADEQAVS